MDLFLVFPQAFAIIASLAWALSALVINEGLERLREDQNPYRIILGLCVSLLSGSLFLTFAVLVLSDLKSLNITTYLILAGLFTFPLGTGLYYRTAELYEKKAEIAAQFVRVKPIFSVVFAIFLGEVLTTFAKISLPFIVFGLSLLLIGTVKERFTRFASFLGLATAFSWALGEAFMKLGIASVSPLLATYVALIAGTSIYIMLFSPLLWKKIDIKREVRNPWIFFFLTHGILSFGIGYTALFTSIKLIGLGRTALITAFWPILAIIFGYLRYRMKGIEYPKPMNLLYLLPASILLIIGSIIAIY